MTSDASDEFQSTIPMDRQHLETLAHLLDDLDTHLRQTLTAHRVRAETQPPETNLLIDLVGFQALRLRHILDH